ncbi:MAG TPA: hypothetical protein VH275_08165 [Solirubrobacterales bacterium]|jgi:hypothetical protein|nr:hypothetical protein [Solirubrobacterales bacterium]
MKSRFLPKLNFSNAIAMIALFVALGGAAIAAGLPKRSVGANQLKRGAITAAAIRKAAVKSGKLAPKSVVAGKLGPNAVLPGNIVNGAITSAKLGAGSVIANSIKNGVVTTNKLNNKAVTTAKLGDEAVTTPILANGSVTPGKLSKEFGPLINPLKSGQTLQGTFAVGGAGKELTTAIDGQTFQFPLANGPAVNVVNPSTAVTPACPGLGSGQAPAAAAANLCIYVVSPTNLKTLAVPAASANRFGFGLEATANEVDKPFSAYGLWAVTAP